MGRLFTFGCSFTQYAWPTWANILAYEKKVPNYNFALAGLGNVGIMHRIVEADCKFNFQPDDEIYIMWSSWSREDRIKNGEWNANGSVFNTNNKDYYGYFIRKYWNYENDLVKNSTAIISTNKMYKDIIKWQGSAFDFFINEAYDTNKTKRTKKIINIYKENLPKMTVLHLETQNAFNTVEDSHPDILHHLNITKEIICPESNQCLSNTTVEKFTNLHYEIQHIVDQMGSVVSLDNLIKKIENHIPTLHQDIWDVMNYFPVSDD